MCYWFVKLCILSKIVDREGKDCLPLNSTWVKFTFKLSGILEEKWWCSSVNRIIISLYIISDLININGVAGNFLNHQENLDKKTFLDQMD